MSSSNPTYHLFANIVPYETEEDLEKAKEFLSLWEFFVLKNGSLKLVDRSFVIRPPEVYKKYWGQSSLIKCLGFGTVALKICVTHNFAHCPVLGSDLLLGPQVLGVYDSWPSVSSDKESPRQSKVES